MSESQIRRQVSSEGMKKLEEKLAFLKGTRRAEVSEKLNIARGYGDLSENAEYDAAKNEQALLEAEIMQLEATINNAEIVDNLTVNNNEVSIGSTVKVRFVEDGEEDSFVRVGALESDPLKNRISNESAVGMALLGAKPGDKVTVEPPSGETYDLEVLEISHE